MTELRNHDLDKLIEQAVAVHLTDAELGQYHDSAADEVTRARIAAHLRRCLTCSQRYDTMTQILATYHEVEVPSGSMDQLKALIAQMSPPHVKEAMLKAIVGSALLVRGVRGAPRPVKVGPLRARATTQEKQRGQTEDGSLRWLCEEDEGGDVILHFGSPHLWLDGFKIIFKIGPIRKEITLARKAEDQVGAKLVLTREERKSLTENVEVIIESLAPPERSDAALTGEVQ
jgi:hypothetical protein